MNVPPMKSVVLHQTFPSSRIKTLLTAGYISWTTS